MSKYLPGILIGLVVAIGAFFLFNFVFEGGFMPFLMAIFFGVFVAYIFANLAGNKKVANASDADKQAALQRQPPPGKALLYVYREGFVAKLAGLNLQLDGKDFAQLTAPKFTCVVVPPGPHRLTCGFGGLAGPQSKKGAYEFTAPADSVAAVGIGVQMGLVQGSMAFTPLTDAQAIRAKLGRMPMTAASPAEF